MIKYSIKSDGQIKELVRAKLDGKGYQFVSAGYISNLVWIILLGILFIISIRVCNVEKKIYKILFLLFLAANVVYIIYSIRYYGVMTLGLFVSIAYMIDLMRSVQTNK